MLQAVQFICSLYLHHTVSGQIAITALGVIFEAQEEHLQLYSTAVLKEGPTKNRYRVRPGARCTDSGERVLICNYPAPDYIRFNVACVTIYI